MGQTKFEMTIRRTPAGTEFWLRAPGIAELMKMWAEAQFPAERDRIQPCECSYLAAPTDTDTPRMANAYMVRTPSGMTTRDTFYWWGSTYDPPVNAGRFNLSYFTFVDVGSPSGIRFLLDTPLPKATLTAIADATKRIATELLVEYLKPFETRIVINERDIDPLAALPEV